MLGWCPPPLPLYVLSLWAQQCPHPSSSSAGDTKPRPRNMAGESTPSFWQFHQLCWANCSMCSMITLPKIAVRGRVNMPLSEDYIHRAICICIFSLPAPWHDRATHHSMFWPTSSKIIWMSYHMFCPVNTITWIRSVNASTSQHNCLHYVDRWAKNKHIYRVAEGGLFLTCTMESPF